MSYTVAIAGATGLVGRTMLRVLEEHNFPIKELKLLASARSAGQVVSAFGKEYIVEELTEHSFAGCDIALFSAGGSTSKQYAPYAAAAGCVVIDNSSAWRMHPNAPLVVPEVNAYALEHHHGIIANPNCSTIQMVVALQPIHEQFGLKRVVVSTYQSVSGAGQKGVDHLQAEILGKEPESRISTHPLAYNTVFHTITDASGFSEEEIKMKNETRKIMNLPDVKIAVTCVRVPVLGAHSESVNVETEKPMTVESIRAALQGKPGITIVDDPINAVYPTPVAASNKDDVFVGRIRLDDSVENGAHLWVVSDNLRKGAATNAVQIAESLVAHNWLRFEPVEQW
ncbi:MAG: aspartate-semialdehyde dehydrogenase [Candidatus Kapaibacterium sp.]